MGYCTLTVIVYIIEGQVWRSDNRGANWQRLRGYNFEWAKLPIPDPHNPGMLYLTTFGSCVWYGPMAGTDVEVEDLYPLP